jgi:CHAT domain-containing protein/tetratricopeptide (TPR) repeat protein
MVLEAARQYLEAGDLARAEGVYQHGYDAARRRKDDRSAARFLSGLAGCRMVRFDYRGALDAYLAAKKLAASIGDQRNLRRVTFNLSSLYQQVGDIDSALREAEEARAGLSSTGDYKAEVLMQLGRLHDHADDAAAEPLFQSGIEAAWVQGDVPLEARAWDLLGDHLLNRGRLDDAERALDQAFRLRALFIRAELGFSYKRLGVLKLAQGELNLAATYTERALAEGVRAGASWPQYRLIHQRGQIRLAAGDRNGALQDFRRAVDLAEQWRFGVMPALSSLDGSTEWLERSIFDSFVETGAAEAVRQSSSDLAAETWEALELNRSASLRESRALADVWQKKLGPEYGVALGQLRSEQARMLRMGLHSTERAERLKLKLTEMEAEVGLSFPVEDENEGENFRSQTSLIHFRGGLGDSELLLSFHLGESESYLWAVSRGALSLHRLPPAARIRKEVVAFRDNVRTGQSSADELGERLYAELFGGLSQRETRKQVWLLSLDDTLFDLPFAALVTERKDDGVKYLVERHSLQIVPGALSLSRGKVGSHSAGPHPAGGSHPEGWFLGVGDPIYNAADPRWRSAQTRSDWGFSGLFSQPGAGNGTGQLNRLVGSGSEVVTSAASWSAGSGTVVVLSGEGARRQQFVNLLSQHPSILHLATHVLTPPGHRGEALIAFGLGPSRETEFLTTSDVAMLSVPGALVTMTGCDSGTGEIRAGAGLLGLARAWQIAGANAVLGTEWAVPDSRGEISESFYRHLRSSPAAESLRRSQVEMIHSGTWRAESSFWAAYHLTGGAH